MNNIEKKINFRNVIFLILFLIIILIVLFLLLIYFNYDELSGNNNETIFCRKLIFATGRDGIGCPNIPNFVGSLPKKFWAHSSDDIDFSTLAKKNVAVIGVGASAVDNAAEALEHGAAEVRHIIRRKKMPRINKMMGIGSFGFTSGFPTLPDKWRWRFMQYSFSTQTPPPRGSTLRVSKNKNAF